MEIVLRPYDVVKLSPRKGNLLQINARILPDTGD